MCSLEDDDCGELFITQSSYKLDNTATEIVEDDGLLELFNECQFGIPNTDFGPLMASVFGGGEARPMYEDISEEEFVGDGMDVGDKTG